MRRIQELADPAVQLWAAARVLVVRVQAEAQRARQVRTLWTLPAWFTAK